MSEEQITNAAQNYVLTLNALEEAEKAANKAAEDIKHHTGVLKDRKKDLLDATGGYTMPLPVLTPSRIVLIESDGKITLREKLGA